MVLSLEIIILNLVFVTALTADSTENLTPSPQIVQAHPINLGNISQNGQIFTQKNSLANRDAGKNTTSTSETETTTVENTTTEYDDSVIEDENIAVFNTPYIDDIDAVAKTTPAELIETKTTLGRTTTPTKLIDKNITLFNKIIYTEQKPAAEENQTSTSRKATMSNDWIWIILLVASLLCLCVIFAKMAYTRYHSNTYYVYEPVSGRALLALSTSRQPRHRD